MAKAESATPAPAAAASQPALKQLHTSEPNFFDDAQPNGELMTRPWAKDLQSRPGMVPVMTAGALLAPDSAMPKDHLFTSLLRLGLVEDLTCFFERPASTLYLLTKLGSDVCGHASLVHGGMSATIIDETMGALVYMLKKDGQLGDGPAFTARLEVDYRKPLPAPGTVVCSAAVASVEGRKIWLTADVMDKPNGNVFVQGKALFLTAKPTATVRPEATSPAAAARHAATPFTS